MNLHFEDKGEKSIEDYKDVLRFIAIDINGAINVIKEIKNFEELQVNIILYLIQLYNVCLDVLDVEEIVDDQKQMLN